MKVLLVEDDAYKREHVRKFLASTFPDIDLDFAESYQSALRRIVEKPVELIVLDMTLPTFDKRGLDSGGRLRPLGGRELFDQMRRRRIASRLVVLTGYDILGEGSGAVAFSKVAGELQETFPELFVTAIFYSRAEDTWMQELKAAIEGERSRNSAS